jgi:gluconokinase
MYPNHPKEPTQHIWVVTGPAGCGKSTVGKGLANELHYPFLEGDDVRSHPKNTYNPRYIGNANVN